jgi:hypothetical protein
VQLQKTGDWTNHSDAATAAFPLSATIVAHDLSISGRCVAVDQQGHGTFKALPMNEATAVNGGQQITNCEILMGMRFVELPTPAGGPGRLRRVRLKRLCRWLR